MNRNVVIAVLAGLVSGLPVSASAQGGIFGRGRGPGKLAREPGITVPESVNPVNLLIAHRQDLALSDTQFISVIEIKRALDSTNAPMMRKLDSVQRLFRGRPIFSEPSRAHRDSVAEARELVQEVVAGVRETISTARDKAYALLSVQQLEKAQGFEQEAQRAIDDETRRSARGKP